jgi:hypothetical protein
MAKWAEMLGAFDSWFSSLEDGERSPRTERTYALELFLNATAAVIRKDGWVSRKLANESERTATASTVGTLLRGTGNRKYDKEMEDRYYNPERQPGESIWMPEDLAVTEMTLGWLASLPEEAENDYLHNLGVIARSGLVSGRTAGLAASAIAAAKRALKKDEERASAPGAVSGHVGAIGERLRDVKVELIGSHELPPTEFGTRMLVRLADDAGNIFVWFTGGDALYGSWDFGNNDVRPVVVGDTLYLTGTVKRHGEFGGHKQTELSRCKLGSIAPVAKAPKGRKKAQPELSL